MEDTPWPKHGEIIQREEATKDVLFTQLQGKCLEFNPAEKHRKLVQNTLQASSSQKTRSCDVHTPTCKVFELL